MKKYISIVLALTLLLSLSGCFYNSPEELYSLPQTSEQYLQLTQLVQEEIAAGSEFAAPISGNYRQSIQLSDLNGDNRDEALAFFREADQTLKICIYNAPEEDFVLAAALEGDGMAIGSIEYADLDGDGYTELIVAWQANTGQRLVKAYSMKAWSASVLLTAECAEFRLADMDGDGCSDLLCLNFNAADGGSVTLHSLKKDGEPVSTTAKLSPGLTDIERLRTGYLSDEAPALFVESYNADNQVVTDIFTITEERLVNISADPKTGLSYMDRDYAVFCSDVDGDRIMEVPDSWQMHSQTEDSAGYWGFDWYSFDSSGSRELDMSTYHCYSDEWFLTLPEGWREVLTVRREDSVAGERVVVLSAYNARKDSVTDLLYIYTLTGDNRWDRARLANRFVLLENDTTIYAAKILNADSGIVPAFGQEDILANFRVLYTEWLTGAL